MSFQNPQKTNLEICFQQPHPLLVRNASFILGQISFSDRTLHDTSANLRNSLQRGLTPLPDSEKIVWCRKHLALQIVFLEAAAAPQKGGECYKYFSSSLCQKASSSELDIWIINIPLLVLVALASFVLIIKNEKCCILVSGHLINTWG